MPLNDSDLKLATLGEANLALGDAQARNLDLDFLGDGDLSFRLHV